MSKSQFLFNKKQLDRLFPYYILLNKNLIVEDCGEKLKKISDFVGGNFSDNLLLDNVDCDLNNFSDIKSLAGQLVQLRIKHSLSNFISGYIEFIESSEQLLIACAEYSTQHDAGLLELEGVEDSQDQLKILSRIAEININTIIITDREDKITWVNKSFSEMTGYSFSEAVGKKPEHLLHGPNTSQVTLDYLNKQVSSGQAFNADIYNYSKSGKPYWARVKGQPIYSQNGELIGFFALIEDFTKEKEAQELLKKSEDRFKTALEKVGNLWEHNFVTRETSFSKANNVFWGNSGSESAEIEDNWWNSIHKEDLGVVLENFKKYKQGLIDSHVVEYRFVNKNGETKWVLDRGLVTEKDEHGKPLSIVGTHTDITPIKETEQDLEKHVKQLQSLSENIPGVIYEYEYRADGTSGLKYISPTVNRVFGLSAEDFWGRKYITPVDLERINKKEFHSRNTLEPFYDEVEINLPGKESRWYAVHSSYSYTSKENSKIFTGFMSDITERKSIEESLRINEEKYRSILANMNLGMVEVDREGIITYANNSFCQMSDYPISELIGKSGTGMFYLDQALVSRKWEDREKGITDAYEIETRDKNGDKKWWLISGAPRFNDKSELVGSICVFLDVTDKKKQEQELIDARNEAQQLAYSKESFLANMSHEIRTPMNAIMSMSNQLAKTDLKPEQEFYLETIHTASKSLLVIINDVLDLSKIDAGKLSFENIGFSLIDVLQNAMQVITHKGEQKGLDLNNFYFDGNISPVLIGDPYRLNQVLLNLMTNAVKFTEHGSVDLICKVLEDKPSAQLIRISVIDTGIGMEEAFVKHVFDKFSQEYDSVSRKYGGTGLGMSISKNLVEQMGGEIFVESKKGVGTNISFVIELQKGITEDMPKKIVTQFSEDFLVGKKVLIVDDNDLNRLVASILLLDFGATVMVAENGEIALDMIDRENFDLILMDIQMPVMNGYQTTRKIRENGNDIPIIALTASAIKGEREKCIDAGMNDYITKPIDEEEFLKIIDRWIMLNEDAEPVNIQEIEIEEGKTLYDLSSLRTISKGREDFVKKMVDMFCDQMPTAVKEMIDAYENNNYEHMGAMAHKLKSSIDHLNISSIQRVIRNIETIGTEHLNDPTLPDALKEVDEVISRVIAMLREEFADEPMV